MARVGRLSGAIWLHVEREHYLLGNTKVPCNWAAHGFEPPGEIDAIRRPFVRLSPCREVAIEPPYLELELDDTREAEALARLLAERLLVERTGSVSERLWRLITGQRDEDDEPSTAVTPARWLTEIPAPLWQIVRDTVLRCS